MSLLRCLLQCHKDLQGYGPLSFAETSNPPPLDVLIVVPYANVIEGRTIGTETNPSWDVTHVWQVRGSSFE
jgi:hypothetical protein